MNDWNEKPTVFQKICFADGLNHSGDWLGWNRGHQHTVMRGAWIDEGGVWMQHGFGQEAREVPHVPDNWETLGNLAESRDGGRCVASFSSASTLQPRRQPTSRPAGQLRVADVSCASIRPSPCFAPSDTIAASAPYAPDSLSIALTGESPWPRRQRDHATATRSSRSILFPLPRSGWSRHPIRSHGKLRFLPRRWSPQLD